MKSAPFPNISNAKPAILGEKMEDPAAISCPIWVCNRVPHHCPWQPLILVPGNGMLIPFFCTRTLPKQCFGEILDIAQILDTISMYVYIYMILYIYVIIYIWMGEILPELYCLCHHTFRTQSSSGDWLGSSRSFAAKTCGNVAVGKYHRSSDGVV